MNDSGSSAVEREWCFSDEVTCDLGKSGKPICLVASSKEIIALCAHETLPIRATNINAWENIIEFRAWIILFSKNYWYILKTDPSDILLVRTRTYTSHDTITYGYDEYFPRMLWNLISYMVYHIPHMDRVWGRPLLECLLQPSKSHMRAKVCHM